MKVTILKIAKILRLVRILLLPYRDSWMPIYGQDTHIWVIMSPREGLRSIILQFTNIRVKLFNDLVGRILQYT